MFFSANAFGQSIREVLVSVQERRLALMQRRAVEAELKRAAELVADPQGVPMTPLAPVDDDDLIDWGDGLERFPTQAKIEELPFTKVIEKLNRASREVDYLKQFYLNVDGFSTTQKFDLSHSYTDDGVYPPPSGLSYLPSAGDFDDSNWRQKILVLASLVEQLRALAWPMEVCQFRAATMDNSNVPIEDMDLGVPLPTPSNGANMADCDSTVGMTYVAQLYKWGALGQPSSFYTELGGVRGIKTMVLPENILGDNKIDEGKLVLYRRLRAPLPWIASEVYPLHKDSLPFHFRKEYHSVTNTFERGEFVVGNAGLQTRAEVEGMEAQVRSRWTLPQLAAPGEYSGYQGYLYDWQPEDTFPPGMDFVIELETVCFPDFAPIQRATERHLMSVIATNPGSLQVNASKYLAEVDLGRGLRDRNQTGVLTFRPDGFGTVEFSGSLSGFKAIFETDHDKFSQAVVEEPFGGEHEASLFTPEVYTATGFSDKAGYVSAWSAPRLRQIFGSDISIDIEYVNDYKRVLRFFWTTKITVPGDNVVVPVEITGEPFKTIVVENADGVENGEFPESEPSLHIFEVVGEDEEGVVGLHWEVKRTEDWSGHPLQIVIKGGSAEGGQDLFQKTISVEQDDSILETTLYGGATTIIATTYTSAQNNRFSLSPEPVQISQGGRVAALEYTAFATSSDLSNTTLTLRPMLTKQSHSGTGWTLDGAEVAWNQDGTFKSSKFQRAGGEYSQANTWDNLKVTASYKLDGVEYRAIECEYSEALTKEQHRIGGAETIVLFNGPEEIAPWTVKQIKSPEGYFENFTTTPGVDVSIQSVLEGWGDNHDAGRQTIVTTNRMGGLITRSVVSTAQNPPLTIEFQAGGEHEGFGSPGTITGLRGDITTIEWQTAGRNTGAMLKVKSPEGIERGATGYDYLGRPSGYQAGFATYSANYADRFAPKFSGPESENVEEVQNQFGELVSWSTTARGGMEVNLAQAGASITLDGRSASLDLGSRGEVTGVGGGMGSRGTRESWSLEQIAGYSRKLLCRASIARNRAGTDSSSVREYFDERGRMVRRISPGNSGGELIEGWSYSDLDRSVTYYPGPGPYYPYFKPIKQSLSFTSDSVTITTRRESYDILRSISKIGNGKIVALTEVNDDSHGGVAQWKPLSHVATDVVGGVITTTPLGLPDASRTVTISTPSPTGTMKVESVGTDDESLMTMQDGRPKTISGKVGGIPFSQTLNYNYNRLGSVASTLGGRAYGLQFNNKGQLTESSGPGFHASLVPAGAPGYSLKVSDSVQDTEVTHTVNSVGDFTSVTGNVHEPVAALTQDTPEGGSATSYNTNLTVTRSPDGSLLKKEYVGGGLGAIEYAYNEDNSISSSGSAVEAVTYQPRTDGLDAQYYGAAGTVATNYYKVGLRKDVSGPTDGREFKYQHLSKTEERYMGASELAGATQTWSYDDVGNRNGLLLSVSTTGSSFASAWSLDNSGRPLVATGGHITGWYEYSPTTGELATFTRGKFPDGIQSPASGASLTTTLQRDALGRVTGCATVNSLGESFNYTYAYNQRNLRESRLSASGVSWSAIQYDSRGRLTHATLGGSALPSINSLVYDYDNRNNRNVAGSAVTFANNGVDQVTGRTLSQRGYGVHGTVAPGGVVRVFHPQAGAEGELILADEVTGAYSAYWTVPSNWAAGGVGRIEMLVRGTLPGAGVGGTDAVADQQVWVVVPASAETYVYDGAGRTTEDSGWVYAWNGMGCLTQMQRKSNTSVDPSVATEVLNFTYDGDRRRTKKVRTLTFNNGQPQRIETSKMHWSDWLPVCEEVSVNGGLVSRRWFVWGKDVSGTWEGAGGIGGLVAIEEEGGRRLLPVEDGLGNIVAVINEANGYTIARFDYSPYGELVSSSGDLAACPFRYQSKYHDTETGLSYFGYRYYSAKLGRWISRDPLGEDGGFNLYGYCGNDPVNYFDPLGLATEEQRHADAVVASALRKVFQKRAALTDDVEEAEALRAFAREMEVTSDILENAKEGDYLAHWLRGKYWDHYDVDSPEDWETAQFYAEQFNDKATLSWMQGKNAQPPGLPRAGPKWVGDSGLAFLELPLHAAVLALSPRFGAKGESPRKLAFIGDTGLFKNQFLSAKDIFADPGNRIYVTPGVLREVLLPKNLFRLTEYGNKARKFTAKRLWLMVTSKAQIRITASGKLPPGLTYQALTSAKFGITDLRMLLAAKRGGLVVVTGNNKIISQVASQPLRKAIVGDVEVFVLDLDIMPGDILKAIIGG